ncbi:farnesol dehydrogenase-like [Tenebrio molitor]|uniref:farnesol dehydrogenase-like n=1 Tax=Tenebrio molitor TaxID=7067 RepID=UPI0036249F43
MVGSMDRWRGKVAIVTGANSGIGAATARQLVDQGLKVAGFDRQCEYMEQVAKKVHDKEGQLHAVKVDICKEDEIQEGFIWTSDNLGPVHILINCAGIGQETTLWNGDTEKWKKTFDTNVMGLCIATREAVKIMKAEKIDGHIIHINSYAGHVVPNFPRVNVYAASKYAVTALTETLRQELNQLGVKIKITSVSPGRVNTGILTNNNYDMNSTIVQRMVKSPGLNAEDVADSILHVLSTPPHVQIHELTIKPIGEVY